MALRDGADGQNLRSSIEKLADQEGAWFRSTPPHTLATERVMQTLDLALAGRTRWRGADVVWYGMDRGDWGGAAEKAG
jgi:hypothetical protein